MSAGGWGRVLACGAVAGLLVGAGAVAATASGADGVLHGCAHERSGVLRLLADGEQCREGERAVEWSVQGPQGPQGPPGPQGPQGPQGPAAEEPDWLLACQEALEACARQEVARG